MKTNKLLFSMQLLSTIPPILFIVIYAHDNYVYMVIALLLTILMGTNIYRYTQNISLIRYSLLSILVVSFFIYALYGLGSKEAPQTFETLKRGNIATFHFEKPVHIDKMCYYIGIDKNVNFDLYAAGKHKWKKFYSYKENFPFSFRWKCFDENVTLSKARLFVTKNEMMLGEVRFMSEGKNIPFKSNKPLLGDEQNTAIDTTYFGGMFFDEIYHSRTAYEILHGIKVYETTHPYLGKILIIPGIEFFGMTPFGWSMMALGLLPHLPKGISKLFK